ncbi:MAG: DMT family transporter [Rhodoferax sp.]
MNASWMVLGTLFFSLMAVGIKYASQSFGTLEILFYRGMVALIFMGTVLRLRAVPWRTPVPMMHVSRSAAGVFAMGTWFYAIAHLPLATAMTLNYTSSVWVAAFIVGGALLYGNAQRQGPLLAAVLLGFGGVLLALRPTLDPNQLFAGLVGMMSGMGAALAYMQVTALGKAGEPEERVVFYFSLGTAVVGLVGVLLQGGFTAWSAVRWQDAAWLLPIGVLASLGQWSLTRAYRKGATLVVANLQYSGIVFASVFSVLLFDEQIPWMGWAGIGLIIASGILATALRTRALPETPAEDH